MMTHADYRQHVPLHAVPQMPRYASSSDMSTTSSTFDLGSQQQEGCYMRLKIADEHYNNSNCMNIWTDPDYEHLIRSREDAVRAEEEKRPEGEDMDGDEDEHDVNANFNQIIRGWRVTGRMDSLGGRVYLRDENNKVLAVVVRELRGFSILGLTPVFQYQTPHSSKIKTDKKQPLYLWATVKRRNSLKLWRESYEIIREDDKSCYITKECGSRFGLRRMKVLKDGRTCGLIQQSFANGILTNSKWDVQVGTEIGPRAMVCFVAIINKSMGRLL